MADLKGVGTFNYPCKFFKPLQQCFSTAPSLRVVFSGAIAPLGFRKVHSNHCHSEIFGSK